MLAVSHFIAHWRFLKLHIGQRAPLCCARVLKDEAAEQVLTSLRTHARLVNVAVLQGQSPAFDIISIKHYAKLENARSIFVYGSLYLGHELIIFGFISIPRLKRHTKRSIDLFFQIFISLQLPEHKVGCVIQLCAPARSTSIFHNCSWHADNTLIKTCTFQS